MRGILPLLLLAVSTTGVGQETPEDLTKLSLEELMDIQVTSVSRKPQKLSQAAQAVYVITQEDIRRSGAESLAEALRLAPGLNVAQISSNQWAVTSRGFNGRFANKLLVLIDGRSVYTPLFSGVFWEEQDTLLEDVDRIEVIRGPGAAVWGANAVNGVINIITKAASQTQGGLISAGGGAEERAFGRVRFGGRVGNAAYRVWAKAFERDSFADSSGASAGDGWHAARGGFRVDWSPARPDSFTLQGELYDGRARGAVATASLQPPFVSLTADEIGIGGGSVLGRWRHSSSPLSSFAVEVYYDRTRRLDSLHREVRDTFDLDFTHRFTVGSRHDVVWGLGFRTTRDDLAPSFTVTFSPASRRDDLWSGFLEDDITLVPGRLRLTLGSKFEHNDYTGLEVQPNGRILVTPSSWATLWVSVSRAVRTPSRFEHDARVNVSVLPGGDATGGLPVLTSALGDPVFTAETLVAYELGFRAQPARHVAIDVSGFYNDYRSLRTFEPGAPTLEVVPGPPHLLVPLRPANGMQGQAYGVELAATWNVLDSWKLLASCTWLEMDLRVSPESRDTTSIGAAGDSPRRQFQLHSYLGLPHRITFDGGLYYVDRVTNQDVPSYVRVDARVAWSVLEALELSFVAQNLFQETHPEAGPSFLVNPSQIERRLYGKVLWRF